jgi:hypothetical protein
MWPDYDHLWVSSARSAYLTATGRSEFLIGETKGRER